MRKNSNFKESFTHAFHGLITIIEQERNIKMELLLGALSVAAGFLFHISYAEWLAILLCCILVLTMECVNSAIEKAVDLISPNYHELAKLAKDFAAGAVLLAAIGSAIIGALIFLPKLFTILIH